MPAGSSWVIRRDENGLLSWEPKTLRDETDFPTFEVYGPVGVHHGDKPSHWPCRTNELYCPHAPACPNY